jgi:preprotein translocase subunit SecY
MSLLNKIIGNLPEVQSPTQKKLSFKEKLKWTGIIVVIFYILGYIPLFGLGRNALENFEYLSVILGATFGSITSLGIGPIVTASIILQLLNGSGILKFDLTTQDGKRKFQGVQKLLAIFMIVFESFIFVFMGGLAPAAELAGTSIYLNLELLLVFQLTLGGFLILLMDDVINKWGFGSGISLFIAAGVSQSVFIRALSWLPVDQFSTEPTGAIPLMFYALANQQAETFAIQLGALVSTIVIFCMAVYAQAMKIEIPLSFGRIRGQGIRWPLNFIYTSVIPVILVAALMANIQLWAKLLQGWLGRGTFLGTFQGNQAVSGLATYVSPPNIINNMIKGSITLGDFWHAFIYLIIMVSGCVVFSYFWVQTSGMDAKSQAKQIMASGLQVPGFRKDKRILERMLNRYIMPLTIMGGITIGVLSTLADISGSLANGTGLLLTVMIIYKLYEEISKEHMMDMNPMMRKMME